MSLKVILTTAAKVDQRHKAAKALLQAEQRGVKAAKAQLAYTAEAHGVAQQVAQQVQQEVHQQIAAIVTRCLAAVFPESYKFKIHFERSRGKTEARMVFIKGGEELKPLEDAGLGVADVASFALRIAALVLSNPQKRRLLILDEPFKFLSTAYRPAVAQLLELLSTELKIQFIIVTHLPELEIGKVIRI